MLVIGAVLLAAPAAAQDRDADEPEPPRGPALPEVATTVAVRLTLCGWL
jgi:hypothetical protein